MPIELGEDLRVLSGRCLSSSLLADTAHSIINAMPKKTNLACTTNGSLLTTIPAKLLVRVWVRSPGESVAVNDILKVNARVVNMRHIDPLTNAKLDPEKAEII